MKKKFSVAGLRSMEEKLTVKIIVSEDYKASSIYTDYIISSMSDMGSGSQYKVEY